MNGASLVTLGEIVAPRAASIDPSKHADEEFELYSVPAFDARQPDLLRGASIGSTKQVVEPGDVLLSKIVPHIRRAWVVGGRNGRRMIASSEWIVFRSERVHPGYLRHVLVGDLFHARFMSTVAGVGGSLLRTRPAHVANLKITLPSLPEQRRIAAILDQAEALRAKRRDAIVKLTALSQSVFIDMFGDPAANSKNWARALLGDVISSASDGPHVSPAYVDSGIPLSLTPARQTRRN